MTYASYKEYFELYITIHCPTAFQSLQIALARKDIALQSDATVKLYKTDSWMGHQYGHTQFTLSAGTYSFDDIFKRLHIPCLLYLMAYAKHHLIHHLP